MEDRERAFELIRRFGWNATSFQALECGMRYWFSASPEGCIAYLDTGRAWVTAGAPIGAVEHLGDLGQQFVEAARRAGRRTVFFGVERRFTGSAPFAAVQIGEQPVWDPSGWPGPSGGSRSMREQLRRARAKGVSVRAAGPEELGPGSPLRQKIESLVQGWLTSRRMPRMGFLVQLDLFSYPGERRLFIAEMGSSLVGFLSMVPVFARSGWLLEDLLRSPSAPNGTSELLVDAGMRAAAAEGSRYATLGLAPLSGSVGRWLRLARRLGARLYNFRGLRAFRQKFRPPAWEPIYLAFPPGQNRALTLADALSAFTPGGILQFGLAAFARAPELPLSVLTALLVPWTLLLALAPTARWFPAPWIQGAWVAFDLVLLAGLFSLARRWRTWLGRALALLITADAALTALEIALFNLPRAGGWFDWTVLSVAVAGPLLASGFLWTAVALRSREPAGGLRAP